MKKFYKIPILLFVLVQFTSCSNNDDMPNPSMTILEDRIVCEYCHDFGYIIEADNNELFISHSNKVLILAWKNQSLELNQTIDLGTNAGVHSMLLKHNYLLIGHIDEYGTGSVSIYEKRNNYWDEIQVLTIGRSADGFGSAIDISEDYLAIGASAPSMGYGYKDVKEGRIYIYNKALSGWEPDAEFKSQSSSEGDKFGESIAIQRNYILAGSCCVPTHIYHFDGVWKFLRTEPISNSKIVHHENNFLATNTWSYDSAIFAFNLKDNGDFEYSTISFDYSEHERSGHGEILDMYETNSIFALEADNYCFTMEYQNSEWINIIKTDPEGNECYVMLGIEIAEDKIYMGGESVEEGWKDIVYILDY